MSKKMKGVDVARHHPLYEDAKAKLKYKTLLQDYQDLQKDVFDMKTRLEAAKRSKKRLLAEVRFLGRRYTYLLQTKSLKQQQQEQSREMRLVSKLTKGGEKSRKNEETRFKLPPLSDLKHKGRVYAGKEEGTLRNSTSVLGLDHNLASSNVKKKAYFFTSSPISNKYFKKRRISGVNDASAVSGGISKGWRGGIPVFDLNQDTSLVRNEAKLPNQAPTFDLNEISMDEEIEI